MLKICKNITETIGNTPIIALEHPLIPNGKTLYLKLEQFNPTFSIKDRTALGLVLAAFKSGHLKQGGTIIESTSGNLGKSLALLGAAMNFHVIIVLDPKVSENTLNLLKAYGAEIEMVTVPDEDGGYQHKRIERVRELLSRYPDAYWPNQYDNPDNPQYHHDHTAMEICEMKVDLLAGAVSTGGHLSGIARWLKNNYSKTQILACDVKGSAIFGTPFEPYLVNGIGLAWRAKNTDLSLFDYQCQVNDQNAISLCHLLAREQGVLMGGSGGIVVYAALQYLHKTNIESALALIPDTGINYLSNIYDENWLREKGITLLSFSVLLDQLYATE